MARRRLEAKMVDESATTKKTFVLVRAVGTADGLGAPLRNGYDEPGTAL